MSVDTRTPRTPTGDRPSGFDSGFDDAPALSMVKVPSDPAQVIVNHASFRVQLGTGSRTQSPRVAHHVSSADLSRRPAAGTRRRAPVVWSGRSAPDDTGATRPIGTLPTANAGGSACRVTQPKLNDTTVTSKGEAGGIAKLRERAASTCKSYTGSEAFSADTQCRADGPYVHHCSLKGQCSGEYRICGPEQ